MNTVTTTFKQIGLLAVALTLALAANLAYGQWADPTGAPPTNNAEAPINVSADYQAKLGDLGAVRERSDQYCDAAGLNCFTPTGSTTISRGGTDPEVKSTGIITNWPDAVICADSGGREFILDLYHHNADYVAYGDSGDSDDYEVSWNKRTRLYNSARKNLPGCTGKSIDQIIQDEQAVFYRWSHEPGLFGLWACEVEFVARARTNNRTNTITLVGPARGAVAGIGMWQDHDDAQNFPFTQGLAYEDWGSERGLFGVVTDESEKIATGFMSYDLLESMSGFHQARENESGNAFEFETFRLETGETASFVSGAVRSIDAGLGRVTATVGACRSI